MSTDSLDRVELDTNRKGRLGRAWDTLQSTIRQPVETVTRHSILKSTTGDVEDIDPPDDIDELYALYEEIGLIRANLNQFVSDVVEPGVRIEAEDDTTEAYIMGGDDAPDFAPEGGFLSNCAVFDEKRRPFLPLVKASTLNRWVRGTFMAEYLKADDTDPESEITGFRPFRPETVSARTLENTNILVAPEDTEKVPDEEITKRDEAAAFVQFDEQSILGRRSGFGDRTSIPLSQNDVLKQTLDQNIGGDDPEDGVFGTSILRAVKDDATEYRSIKRDRAEAIKTKAYGIWTAQFRPEVVEAGDETILIEWDDDDVENTESEVESMGPGSVLFSDARIELESHESDVPQLGDTLRHYVDDILTPLPAPKYTVGFETDINQFVTQQQDARYQQVINEERQYQERSWTKPFRLVAERHDQLTADGLKVHIEPEQEDSPILSLGDEEIDRIATFAGAMADLFGPGGAPAYVDEETLLAMVLQLPEDAVPEGGVEEMDVDESDQEALEQFQAVAGGDD